MSDHFQKTISELELKLAEQIAAVHKTKMIINQLSEYAGMAAPYPDLGEGATVPHATPAQRPAAFNIKPDQFFGKPLATAVRFILQMRKEADLGPAEIKEIYKRLKEGGYQFDAKDDENAVRGLQVSISKNTALFARLPSGLVGLTEWYGNGKPAKKKKKGAAISGESSDSDLDPDSDSEGDLTGAGTAMGADASGDETSEDDDSLV